MAEDSKNRLHYLTINSRDEDWGIVVTTVGCQSISPKGHYPPVDHPVSYNFQPQQGRILKEYQLVYITQGSGYFSSQSCKFQKISAGTMILLFPGEWHSYYPDSETGWEEYWVGFRGVHIDKRVENGFFTKAIPLHTIGLSASIIDLYEEIMEVATKEHSGYQQMISSIVLHILGMVYYKERNNSFKNTFITEKINEARIIMKEKVENPPSAEQVAEKIGMGYTWFRRMFKEYTGTSPAQYQIQQQLMHAKELLTTTELNISEIAYRLNFDSGGQFSTFFKNKEGITPSEFRERMH
jgi:AraC-like DNA-binding protein